MKLKSIKFKISIIYTIILGIILIGYSSVLYFSLYTTLYNDLDKELMNKSEKISENINKYLDVFEGDQDIDVLYAIQKTVTLRGKYVGKDDLTIEQNRKLLSLEKEWVLGYDKLDLSEDYIHILKKNGRSIVKSKNISVDLRAKFLNIFKNKKDNNLFFSKLKFKKRNLRLIQTPLHLKNKQIYVLQIGTSQKPVIEILENRQMLIIISIPIILIFASFIGRYLVNKILTPVTEITATARNITHKDLSKRIKIKDVDEELVVLVDSFNHMIARLETSFEHIAEFSAQVAHELKTPIAILRGEIELSLRKERSNTEYKRVLNVSLDEAKRVLKTVEDLLLMAKLDYRPEIFKFETFNLTEFFEELCEQTKILALDKNLKITLSMPLTQINFCGDKLHLRRLFYNILHNAVKFTPKGGFIQIVVDVEHNNVKVSIKDSGIGISENDLPQVFDRFFHKEKLGDMIEIGNGLGLNIALSIAKIHQGTIVVTSQMRKETVFTVILPLS